MSGMTPPPSGVELRPAFEWTCENCGRNVLQPAVSDIMSHAETKDYLVQVGDVQEWEEIPENVRIERTRIPEAVKCPHCGREFPVECLP
jgi:ribosomal protein S27E